MNEIETYLRQVRLTLFVIILIHQIRLQNTKTLNIQRSGSERVHNLLQS